MTSTRPSMRTTLTCCDAPHPTPDKGEPQGEGRLAVCGKVPVYQYCAPVHPHHGQAGQGSVKDHQRGGRSITPSAPSHLLTMDLDSDMSCPEWRNVPFSPSSDTINPTILVVFMSLQQMTISWSGELASSLILCFIPDTMIYPT